MYEEIKSVKGHARRPAIDPRILVAVWLYATDERIASAHELARRCTDCDPYKWTCGGVSVNYFLVRGLAKVKTVVLWYVLIGNLLRMVALRAQRTNQAA